MVQQQGLIVVTEAGNEKMDMLRMSVFVLCSMGKFLHNQYLKINKNNNKKKNFKKNLKEFLTNKKLIFTQIISRTQEHVYHHMIQISLWTSAPFHNNEERKVAKQAV